MGIVTGTYYDFRLPETTCHRQVNVAGRRPTGHAIDLSRISQAIHGVSGNLDSSESVSVDLVLRATVKPGSVRLSDWRPDGHVVRAVVMAQGVKIRRAGTGAIDPEQAALGDPVAHAPGPTAPRYGSSRQSASMACAAPSIETLRFSIPRRI